MRGIVHDSFEHRVEERSAPEELGLVLNVKDCLIEDPNSRAVSLEATYAAILALPCVMCLLAVSRIRTANFSRATSWIAGYPMSKSRSSCH